MNNPLQKNGIWLTVGLIFLISLWPKFFIPLIIIAVILIIIFNKRVSTFINNYKTMDGQTINYSQIVNKGLRNIKNIILVVIGLIFLIVIIARMIVIVPAGQTGVYHLFGKVKDEELRSGFHIINPLAAVDLISIRTEEYTMSIAPSEGRIKGDDSIESLTKEGLKVYLDVTVLYHVIEKDASDVYKNIGLDYDAKIIRTEVRNAIREVTVLYDAKELYSEKRGEATSKIITMLRERINPRGIEVEEVLLRNVSLPTLLTQAIESKLTAEQEAQRYDFVLDKEKKEAERKRIEAEGQRDSQKIINESLSNQYLQYLYIQSLKDRAGTIYVPYDLPLFKGLQ